VTLICGLVPLLTAYRLIRAGRPTDARRPASIQLVVPVASLVGYGTPSHPGILVVKVHIWTMFRSDQERPMPTRAAKPIAEPASGPQRLDSSRFDPANRRRVSAPALRTFLAIAGCRPTSGGGPLTIFGGPTAMTTISRESSSVRCAPQGGRIASPRCARLRP
jgi:hypothetical protein